MAFLPLKIPPGINKEVPSLTSEPAWRDCDKVRFKWGQPQKLGGWQQTQAGINGFLGIGRSFISWRLNNGAVVSALGTHKKLYIYESSGYIDITPLRNWVNVVDPLDVAVGDKTVTVNHTAHGLAATGDISVIIENAVISGVETTELNRRQTATYINANSYSFELDTAAGSSITGTGGTVKIHYDFEITNILTNPFDINTDTTLIVNHTAHGASLGDYVTFSGASDANFTDSEVNANHVIASIIDNDSYTVELTTATTATTTGIGGTVTADYEIAVGNQHAIGNVGWGAASWGGGTWGTARAIATEVSELRHWSLDHFGEDLVCCPNGGRIYQWDAGTLFQGIRAQVLANSPDYNDVVIVTNPDRHVVSLGSEGLGFQDKMLVRWPDQETTNDWTATAENTAGDQILSGGSKLFAAARTQSATLLWSDGGLYAMEFQGPPFTFGFTELGRNCGTISYEAVVTHNSVSYWMGENDFFMYDGVVRTIPCSLHTFVFDNINRAQQTKVFAGLITNFHEVIWLYPTTGLEIDTYVIYNFREELWYHGTFDRTAWLDSPLHPYPLAVDSSGLTYHHEFRDDDDGTALNAHIESAEFDIGSGDNFIFARRLIPDMVIDYGNVEYPLKYRRYPHAGVMSETTQTVDANTEKLDIRLRGRQIALRISSNELRDLWNMGTPRLDVRNDGRR